MPTMTAVASQGHGLRLNIDDPSRDFIDGYDHGGMPNTPSSQPRKLSNFFGWKKQQPSGADSPSTAFSERSFSQPASPMPLPSSSNGYGQKPAALDIPRANAAANTSYFPVTPSLPTPPLTSNHMADLERELREISTELANSIKREMELEDQIELLQIDPTSSQGLEAGRRTSDYYSDSGAGSVRYPTSDGEGKVGQLERLRRAAEQEKATLKVEMSERLQDALKQRREAEERSQMLHQRLQGQGAGLVDSDRVRELEATLDETRRKLNEERQFRQNFQDLVGGMRLEIEQHKNEKENLRDEVVPQLRSRIEGLESEAAQASSITYDQTKMQHELQTLREENRTLVSAAQPKSMTLDHTKMQQELQTLRDENQTLREENQTLVSARKMDMLQQGSRIGVISEDNGPPVPPSPKLGGLSRSKSFAARGGRSSRSNSNSGGERGISRADSVRGAAGTATFESREVLTQKVKDIEEQRNALHKTLKLLLDRYMLQEKAHSKRVRKLEMEKDRALMLTPRRTAFHTEVKILKDEVTTLRKRADDALDSKWQYEKNLGSLKTDLDRAQQETTSLRSLLQQRDLFVSDRPGSSNGPTSEMTSTMSLDKAYEELRTTHALSIAHLKDMEAGEGSPFGASGDAGRILELLKQSISEAEAERDRAQSQAEEYRSQARTLQRSELDHLSKEQSLASDLYASAKRMDDLANQVQTQLQSNSALRQRLAEAIERGEREQKTSTVKITQMQTKLRELEEKLMAAQQHSEEMVNTHEDEVKQMEDSAGPQLQRGNPALLNTNGLASPVSTVFALKSPRLHQTTSGVGLSIAEATKTGALEKRVQELEKALSEADKEMGEVVSRMNKAQMEVAELQSERYVFPTLTNNGSKC
jgi:DNA repair exonuclease SbcCD ATPase subunit